MSDSNLHPPSHSSKMQTFDGSHAASITGRPWAIFFADFLGHSTVSKTFAIRTSRMGEVVYRELLMILVLEHLSKEAKISNANF